MVNRERAGDQTQPVIAALEHGFVVVWRTVSEHSSGLAGALLALRPPNREPEAVEGHEE